MKEYSPVKVFAAAQNVVSLTEIIGKIRKSGVDIEMLSTNHGFMIDFSQPVSFATLKLSGSSSEELLRAFDQSDTLVDMDAGSSELSVFGEGITRLVLVKGSNQVDELSFIPQL